MANIKVEKIKLGIEGSDYTYFISISGIQCEETDEVIVLPSKFEGNDITHLGYTQKYEEAHEVWCDWHHPAKGSDWKEAEYKCGLIYFKLPKNVKKIIVPASINSINTSCFEYCKGLEFEFEEGSCFYFENHKIFHKEYKNWHINV